MSEKALGMLKHMRRQIFGQPAPYVVVHGAAISIGVDPGGSECGGLVDELLQAGYHQHRDGGVGLVKIPDHFRSALVREGYVHCGGVYATLCHVEFLLQGRGSTKPTISSVRR
jgi:hypothetical protein